MASVTRLLIAYNLHIGVQTRYRFGWVQRRTQILKGTVFLSSAYLLAL